MNHDIINNIHQKLQDIEHTKHIRILYACESGSRAWGFPSPDSDYDVRFIYLRDISWYLSINEKRDTLDFPVNDLLDFSGWDIYKVLQQIKQSNPVIFEWLQSPVHYRYNNAFITSLWNTAGEYFSPRKTVHHYLGLTRKMQNDLSNDTIKIKKLLYILRSLLAALWVVRKRDIPPMEFSNLRELVVEKATNESIDQLLEIKSGANEKSEVILSGTVESFIRAAYSECEKLADTFKPNAADSTNLNTFFLQLLEQDVDHDS